MTLSGNHDSLSLVVANTGPEIPADRIERMFGPLDRGGQEDRGNRMNLGLGLFIVQKIAQAHGGGIDCTSTPQRTVFTLKVPRWVPEADAASVQGRA
jgi:signal transduction histidine kinase